MDLRPERGMDQNGYLPGAGNLPETVSPDFSALSFLQAKIRCGGDRGPCYFPLLCRRVDLFWNRFTSLLASRSFIGRLVMGPHKWVNPGMVEPNVFKKPFLFDDHCNPGACLSSVAGGRWGIRVPDLIPLGFGSFLQIDRSEFLLVDHRSTPCLASRMDLLHLVHPWPHDSFDPILVPEKPDGERTGFT